MARTGRGFDVLILGGGTAGCVLAARLNEDASRSVGLVEAGPDYGPYRAARWPGEMLDARAVPTTHDWALEDDVSLLRTRIIAGCSAHNACFVVWGAREDYDEWSAAGGSDWSYAALEPYLRRAQAALRTREPSSEELSPWHRGVLDAAVASGFPRLSSFNDLDAAEGVAAIPLNAVGDVRWNTAFAYLDPARDRSNLAIVSEAVVDRVLLSGGRATGARVFAGGDELELRSERVVLAAGAYGSPAILMRSGIGPEDHLRELGVEVKLPHRGVGSNLIDHSGVSVFFEPTERCSEQLRRQDGRGLLFQGQSAVRARTSSCPDGLWDLQFLPWASRDDERIVAGDYEAHISAFAMKPQSRGRVRLRSADPAALPLIEQRFLSDSERRDLDAIVEGVEQVRRLAATSELAELIDHEVMPGREIADLEAVGAWVRQAVRGYFHPVGTCAMGPASDERAVVDPRGGVHGVEQL